MRLASRADHHVQRPTLHYSTTAPPHLVRPAGRAYHHVQRAAVVAARPEQAALQPAGAGVLVDVAEQAEVHLAQVGRSSSRIMRGSSSVDVAEESAVRQPLAAVQWSVVAEECACE